MPLAGLPADCSPVGLQIYKQDNPDLPEAGKAETKRYQIYMEMIYTISESL